MLRKAVFGIVGLMCLWGCGRNTPAYTAAAGSLALSTDGQRVYAVDRDNGVLEVASAADGSKLHSVKVGADPVRVAVGSDDRIYVSNRGDRSVSVVDPETFTEVKRIPVGIEPNGLQVSADGKTLYVVSATALDDAAHGTLTAIDTESLAPQWTVDVGAEPRGLALVGNKAYVSNLKAGQVTVVDVDQKKESNVISLASEDSPDPDVNPNAMTPGAATDVAVSPDGTRVYVPHLWDLSGNIEGDRSVPNSGGGGGGSYGAAGPCFMGGSIVSAGIATITVVDDTPKTDSLNDCSSFGSGGLSSMGSDSTQTSDKDFPPSLIPSSGEGHVIQGPSVALVDPSGSWLFVANRSSNNVIIMPTQRRSTAAQIVVQVGAAPDGLAISKDGKTAYVYSQLDHSLSILRSDSDPSTVAEVARVRLADDTLPPDQVAGRKLFFSAVDTRMSAGNVGIACLSCHVEGREDGHVWQFPDGPRQTPALDGRKIQLTAPYHWAGLFPTLNDFYRETIAGRMGGSGLDPATSNQVTAFIENMKPADNPFQNRPELAEAQARGRAAFVKANCASCHANPEMTDNSLHDVGTLTARDRLEQLTNGLEDPTVAFPQLEAVNTPSLLGLARTAPYLHDGSVLTIRGRIDQARHISATVPAHGDTSMLSDQEMNDLESYLVSL